MRLGRLRHWLGDRRLSYVGRRRGLHLLLGSEVLTGAEGLKESACAAGGVGGRWGGAVEVDDFAGGGGDGF